MQIHSLANTMQQKRLGFCSHRKEKLKIHLNQNEKVETKREDFGKEDA